MSQWNANGPRDIGEYGRQLIRTIHEGLLADGDVVPITKLCAWFGVPRRSVYYKPEKSPPKVDPRFSEPIKALSPAWCSFRMPIICSSLNQLLFIVCLFVWRAG
ncbi:MAG: hypothetical protein AAGF50_01555 [Pseudomonadota bacterium]